jgi:Tfp pilus assembly pilus retraction ATPase PilT
MRFLTKVKDFKTGLVDALRANPTTIVIGEIRDENLYRVLG